MQLTIDDFVAVNGDVVFREIDGEAVLLDIERGTYFGLDPVGTRVWQTLVEHGCARPIVASLLDEFDVAPDTLESDITRLLSELTTNDLIRPRASQGDQGDQGA
jgi:hypothetical protein